MAVTLLVMSRQYLILIINLCRTRLTMNLAMVSGLLEILVCSSLDPQEILS